MKFFTNKISTQSNGSFSDLIKKATESQQQVKTASSEVAEKKKAAPQSPKQAAAKQNSKGKTVKAEAGIDDDGEGKRTDVHHVEGSPKDQNGEPEEDGENKTVDPAGLGSSASSEDEVKIASDEGDSAENEEGVNTGRFPDEFEPKQEAQEDGKADVKASGKKQVKKAGEVPEAFKEHQFKSKDKKDSEGNDDADGKDDDAEKEGMSSCSSSTSKLQRVANLTPKEKNRLKDYFKRYYPEGYSDALTQDK